MQTVTVKIEDANIDFFVELLRKFSFITEIQIPDVTKKKQVTELTDFQSLLLNGPVMTDEEYNLFIEKQNHLNQWK